MRPVSSTRGRGQRNASPRSGAPTRHTAGRGCGGARIDAIHARGFDVACAGIEARPVRGGSASDHLPVHAVVRMRGVGS